MVGVLMLAMVVMVAERVCLDDRIVGTGSRRMSSLPQTARCSSRSNSHSC